MTEKQEKLKKKLQKEQPEFVDSTESLSIEELDKSLLRYAKFREETLTAQAQDEDLNKSKELTKELNGPYKDALGMLKLKTAYIHLLMAEKGSSSNSDA